MSTEQTSEWVERAMELADESVASAAREAFQPGGFLAARSILRAHLESREEELRISRQSEREAWRYKDELEGDLTASRALLEKERESRKAAQIENEWLKGRLARSGVEERKVLAKRDAITKQLAEALKYARRMVKPSECDSAYIDAALAAYQEKKR